MKKFNFNLEKILELKKFNEEECRMALGHAAGILAEIENKIRETAGRLHFAASERFSDPAQMIMWDNYILRLEQETENLTEQAAQAEIVVEEKRALYMEAFSELKAMEKLKENKRKEYRKEAALAEDKELDEIFSRRGKASL